MHVGACLYGRVGQAHYSGREKEVTPARITNLACPLATSCVRRRIYLPSRLPGSWARALGDEAAALERCRRAGRSAGERGSSAPDTDVFGQLPHELRVSLLCRSVEASSIWDVPIDEWAFSSTEATKLLVLDVQRRVSVPRQVCKDWLDIRSREVGPFLVRSILPSHVREDNPRLMWHGLIVRDPSFVSGCA